MNQGALVEHRIEEMGQLGVGRTAVDDIGGNHLLWGLGALAYQLLHLVRTVALGSNHAREQVRTIRALVIRTPGKLVRHARRLCLKLHEGRSAPPAAAEGGGSPPLGQASAAPGRIGEQEAAQGRRREAAPGVSPLRSIA